MKDQAHRVLMYSTPLCGYCAAAKALLGRKDVDYTDIDVFLNTEKRTEMIERSGRRTVPQIFIGDTYVGGFDEMNALDQNGELDALLERVIEPADNQGD
jgi:glutaredoxin 3